MHSLSDRNEFSTAISADTINSDVTRWRNSGKEQTVYTRIINKRDLCAHSFEQLDNRRLTRACDVLPLRWSVGRSVVFTLWPRRDNDGG